MFGPKFYGVIFPTFTILLPFLLAHFSAAQEEEEFPIVQTGNGRIRGFRVDLEPPPGLNAHEFSRADIFLGIPFAQSPTDDLRLERPRPALNWTDTLDASSIPPACVPQHALAAPDFSEDCLHLNLFRPTENGTTSGGGGSSSLPVLIFIHGGGFAVGGTFVEGYANISNNFVSQGIIVVTIQYRLNFLGFFSDGSANNPGNLGLWDQRQALLWIRQNIGHFGGDPERITVWGQSAGAACVSLLSISPQTRDLFRQSIQLSGSLLSPWALNDRVVKTSMETAKSLGCPEGKGQRECLKGLEMDELVEGIQKMEIVRSDFAMVGYNPRLDDYFIPRDIGQAIGSAPTKPTLMGFNPHESLFLTIHYPVSVFAFDSPLTIANVSGYNRSQLVNFIHNCVKMDGEEEGRAKGDEQKTEKIAKLLEEFYAADGVGRGWKHFLEQYTLLLSDIQFIVPFLAEARLKAARGWPVYLYQFDHLNREHAKKLPFRGVVHAGEYPFTLGTELFGNYALDEEDRKVQALLLRSFGTFIKNGRPSSSSDWPPFGSDRDSPLPIVRFSGPKFQLERDPKGLTRRLQFWRKLAGQKDFKRVNGFPMAVP